jgi:hypothetical protein
LFKDSGAYSLFAILAGAVFENYGFNSLKVKKMRENQSCWTGSDDTDLCTHSLLL